MTMVAFNSDNEVHKVLFSAFKKALVAPTNEKDELLAQYTDYVDNLDMILRDIAIEDLGAEPEISDIENYWAVAITNDSTTNFGIICGFEYDAFDDDENPKCEFIKCEGSILVEDNTQIVLDIDPTSIDYSSQKEFNKSFQKKV